MPTKDEHLASARTNEEYGEWILSNGAGRFAEWAVVAWFYAAVHYGRAYLAAKTTPTVITSHPAFDSHFQRATGDPMLYDHHRRLKDESERARYDCVLYSADDARELREKELFPFKEGILELLK